jgi:hypothetical protein
MSKITLELEEDDAKLVQGILDGYSIMSMYRTRSPSNVAKVQAIASSVYDKLAELHPQDQAVS